MTVAEQSLERRQIGAGFEQVRGVAVPQRVDRDAVPQTGGPPRRLKRPL